MILFFAFSFSFLPCYSQNLDVTCGGNLQFTFPDDIESVHSLKWYISTPNQQEVELLSYTRPATFVLHLSFYSIFIYDYESTFLTLYWITTHLNNHFLILKVFDESEVEVKVINFEMIIVTGKCNFDIKGSTLDGHKLRHFHYLDACFYHQNKGKEMTIYISPESLIKRYIVFSIEDGVQKVISFSDGLEFVEAGYANITPIENSVYFIQFNNLHLNFYAYELLVGDKVLFRSYRYALSAEEFVVWNSSKYPSFKFEIYMANLMFFEVKDLTSDDIILALNLASLTAYYNLRDVGYDLDADLISHVFFTDQTFRALKFVFYFNIGDMFYHHIVNFRNEDDTESSEDVYASYEPLMDLIDNRHLQLPSHPVHVPTGSAAAEAVPEEPIIIDSDDD